MNLKKLLLPVALSIGALFTGTKKVDAQVSSYTFAQSSGTYTALSSPTILASATSTTSLDSYVDSIATLPFTFNFGGTGYTRCYMSSNGFVTFGTAAPSTTLTTPISTTATITRGVIAAWARDINAVYNITSGGTTYNGDMSWATLGTAPNRKVVLQWKNFRPVYNTSTTNAYTFDFQVILEETTNKVSISYGGVLGYLVGSTSISNTIQIGLRGSATSDYNNRLNAAATTAFTSSTAGTAASSTQAFNTTAATPGMPSSGLTYTWTPPTCFAPITVTVSGATPSAATLTWAAPTPAPASGYEYEVRTTGAAGSGATGLVTSGSTTAGVTTANVTGFSVTTTYMVYIRSICSASDNSGWSPSVSFTTPPACVTPTGLAISGITATGVTLNWNASPSTPAPNYNYEVRTSGAAGSATGLVTSGTTAGGATTVAITNLTEATTYNVYVQSNCGAVGNSTWSSVVSFKTACLLPSTLPFTENFATVPPSCWSLANGFLSTTASTPTPTISTSNNWGPDQYLNNSVNGPAAVINLYSNVRRAWLISPTIDLGTGGSYVLGFNVGVIDYSGGTSITAPVGATLGSDDTLAVLVSANNGASWSTANAVRTFTAANTPINATGNQRYTVGLSGLTGQIKIAFYGSEGSTSGTDNDIFIDSVTLNTCTPPVVTLGNDTTFCAGNSVTLNPGNLGASFLWSTGATTQTIAVATSGTYNVLVTNSSGCIARDTVVITVNPLPVINLGSDTSFCIGNSVALNAGNTGASYLWSTGATTQTVTASATGSYSVRVTNANGCTNRDTINVSVTNGLLVNLGNDTSFCTGNTLTLNPGNPGAAYLWSTGATTQTVTASATGSYSVQVTNASGCTGRDTINVIVNSLPVVNLGNDTSFCAGNTLTLNAGNAGATYLWSTGDTTQTVTTATAGTYRVRVTNANGCISRDTVVVTVNPLPVVNLGTDKAICDGNSVTLNAGNAGAAYLWSTDATAQTVAATTAGTYSVRVTNSNGCIGRDTVEVTVNPLPVVALGNDISFCAGNSAPLNAGNAGASYLWSTGDTTQTISVTTAGTYSVRVTNTNGCIGRDTLVVTVNPLPVVALGNDGFVCIGDFRTLNAGNAGASYLWSTGATTQTISVVTAGAYSVRVTNTLGCIGRDTVNIGTKSKTVAGTITVTGQSPAFIFTVNGNQNDSLRAWNFGDGIIDTTSLLTSTGHFYTTDGTYTVTFYAINACSIDSVKTTVRVGSIGINNVDLNGELTLFPNPASEFVTLKNTSNQDMKHITVLNVLGAVVSETDATNGKEQRININGLAAGSYLIRVQLNGTTVVRRLQITK